MILVTGAGGTVGSALLKELIATEHKPRAAYHSQAKADRARSTGQEAVVVDFAEPATLHAALEGMEAVFLLGSGGRGQVEGETNVVSAAKAAGVRKIVKLSVLGADQETHSFAKIHRQIERAIESSGLEWTHVRPNGFMQNFVNFSGDSIKTQNTFYQPAADASVSHVDVRDIARVAAQALTAPGHTGKAYELTGPEALTYQEAAETLSRVLGRSIRYVAVPDEAARDGMVSAGMPGFYADYLIELFRAYREGAGRVVTSTVRDVTGRDPTAFEQFVREHAAAFRAA